MLDLRNIVQNQHAVEAALKKRGSHWKPVVDGVVALDVERRKQLQEVEALKNRRNVASQEIGKLKKTGGDSTALMEEMKQVSSSIKSLDETLAQIETKIQTALYEVPNLPDLSVPAGATAAENKEIRKWGTPPAFSFAPKTHDEIGEKLGILDFK